LKTGFAQGGPCFCTFQWAVANNSPGLRSSVGRKGNDRSIGEGGNGKDYLGLLQTMTANAAEIMQTGKSKERQGKKKKKNGYRATQNKGCCHAQALRRQGKGESRIRRRGFFIRVLKFEGEKRREAKLLAETQI